MKTTIDRQPETKAPDFEARIDSTPPADDTADPRSSAMHSDDVMAGVVIGGILTLAFTILLLTMVIVNVWTLSAVK